jgi:isocitrate/isopropylmalate dehydrogenase
MKTFKIAVIAGDGIGKEVVPEGIRVLEAAGKKFGFGFQWNEFDWSCEMYTRTGQMMPSDGLSQLRPFDAIFLGRWTSERSRSSVAVGIADSDSQRVSAVHQPAAGGVV